MRLTPHFSMILLLCSCRTPLLDEPDEKDGFQIDEGRFLLPAGKEAVYCTRIPIPDRYGDEPLFIRALDSKLSSFTHHYFMAYQPAPHIAEQRPCFGDDPLTFIGSGEGERPDPHDGVSSKMLFIAAVGEDRYELPNGYALALKTSRGHFITSHHVVNTSLETQELYGVFNVYTAAQAEVTHPINILNCLLNDVLVPPKSEAALSATCIAPFDLDLVVLGSHAHQHLKKFEMRLFDGEKTIGDPFYTSTQWDSPEIVPLAEPMPLRGGQGITFTCHYQNDADQPVTFGTGDFGEMCAIMSAYAYPKDRPNEMPPSLGTIIFEEGSRFPLFDTTDIEGPF